MTYQSVNPYDGKLPTTFEDMTESQLDTGMMIVNHPNWTTPDLPFGGIQECVNQKLIRVASIDAAE